MARSDFNSECTKKSKIEGRCDNEDMRNSLQFTRQIPRLVGHLTEKRRGLNGLCCASPFPAGSGTSRMPLNENHMCEIESDY